MNIVNAKIDCKKDIISVGLGDISHDFSTKYGLDSEIVASFCDSFATHFDLPKEK